MRSFLKTSFTLATLAAAPWLVAAEGDVVDVTAANFDEFVSANGLGLLSFTAPWCGHCKALGPHYEEAATALKTKSIRLGKIDCVDQADLCTQNEVSGYPTLKVYKNGTDSPYNGPREADGIISYMVKQSLPAVSDVTASNLADFSTSDRIVAVAFVAADADKKSPVHQAFSVVAERLRDDVLFGLSSDAAAASTAKVTPPAVVVYKKFDDGRADLPSAQLTDSDAIYAFLKENSIPLFDQVTGETYSMYAESGKPLAYLFVDPEQAAEREKLLEGLKPLAKKLKGTVNFAWIDGVKFGEHAKSLALSEPKWPSLVIQTIETNLKFPLSQSVELTAKSVTEFVNKFVAGELEPTLKSEPVPEAQDKPYQQLVGSTFENAVNAEDKDVFVSFTASWCGHCKRLQPTWESLGEKFAPLSDKILIAKMDASENDLPPSTPFRVEGFPTIKFKPAGSNAWVDYEGDRSLDNLVAFAVSNAKNDISQPALLKAEGGASAGKPKPTAEIRDEL